MSRARYRDRLVVSLVKDCGMKSSQICDLRAVDFDGDTLVCRVVGKDGLFARVLLPEESKNLLALCCIGLHPDDYIIQNNHGDAMSRRSIQRILGSNTDKLSSGHYSRGNEIFNSLVVEIVGSRSPKDVYLIKSARGVGDYSLKIGSSINPEKRLNQIKSSRFDIPEKLELVGVIKGGGVELEHKLHVEFNYLWIDGEWFQFSEEIVKRFDELTEGG